MKVNLIRMLFSELIRFFLNVNFLVVIPSLIATYWVCWSAYALTLHPLAKIPGPWLACVSRIWIIYHVRRGDMEVEQRKLHKKYGPLIRIAPDEIACSQPEAIKLIYPTQSPLEKSDFYPAWRVNFSKYPDHFSSCDEKQHGERRRIVHNVYSLTNVLQSERYIDQCSELFMKKLGELADQSRVVDLGTWLQWYAFDVIGELYFGKMFGFMEKMTDHGSYIGAIDTCMPTLVTVGIAPSYLRSLIFILSALNPGVRSGMAAFGRIANLAKECVLQRSAQLQNADEEAPRRDLLNQLFDTAREKGEKMDFGINEIQTEVYVAVFAGSDTTAIALRAILYYIMKNPQIYLHLQAELDDAAARGDLSSPVRYAESIKLPLLSACIKEAARLHPSTGLTMPRVAPPGGITVCGTCIPQGYIIGMNATVVHRDEGVFGSDAEVFRPSRWFQKDSTNMDKHILQFGAGTRTCIGKNISISEIHKIVPQILRHFTLKLVDDQEWETYNMWFYKQTNIRVRLERRS